MMAMSMDKFSNDAFAGYLAGFLDGEGCIEINANKQGIRIRLANTHRPTLEGILARLQFGRIEDYRTKSSKRIGHKPLYCYAVSNAPDVERLLVVCQPYLLIKAEKAAKAMGIIAKRKQLMAETDERNRTILARLAAGDEGKAIAADLIVSPQLISRVAKGYTWPTVVAQSKPHGRGIRSIDQSFRLHGQPPTRVEESS